MTARPAGEHAVLVETDVPAGTLAGAISRAALPGVVDIVPGARTVLIITEPGSWRHKDLLAAVRDLPAGPGDGRQPAGLVEIPVTYDGPDLPDVARLTGLSVGEVVARHQAGEYTVGWLGFLPGFGYLTGLDDELSVVPRLASPRLAVPAGSVAIAGGLTAVYPSASPGGWRLLGRTSARMWDPGREPPALLAPGSTVRFRAVPAGEARPDSEPEVVPGPLPPDGPGHDRFLTVLRSGPLTTIQDLGRPGYGAVGVPRSGAADPASLITANRLAGNQDGAAGLELTLGRAVFRAAGPLRLASSGAPALVTVTAGPGPSVQDISFGTSFHVPDGAELRVGAPTAGLRTYLAVTGGIAVPDILGSRSADVLSGLGGGPLRLGDRLPVGAPPTAPGRRPALPAPPLARPELAEPRIPARGQVTTLRILPGPRLDVFDAGALSRLCAATYTVTPASNRTGLRLDGPALQRSDASELPSEGMVTGALQVPHDGKPIVLLADHPTVGGYPVIAVLSDADIGLAAQLRPGDRVAFTT
jgi:KipI family sensor histidine kinase inhibitor